MISTYLPITVAITLILFCVRELLDLAKRFRDNKRVLSTLRLLLSEELKDNFHTLDALYHILVKVDKALRLIKDEVPVVKRVETDRSGNESVYIHIGEKGEYGLLRMPFPQFSTKRYDAYIKEIAALDLDLYQGVTKLYKELRYCEKIRCEVVEYLGRDDNRVYWSFDHRVQIMLERKGKYEKLMQDLHMMLVEKYIEIECGEVIDVDPSEYKKS